MEGSLRDVRRADVLKMLSTAPLLTTEQIAAAMFREAGSPGKRASEFLCSLEEERLLESRRLGDMRKVWRLSRSGRAEAGTDRRGAPFQTAKIGHWLTIGDVYLQLLSTGQKLHFETELREPYVHAGKERVFAPDVFFIFGGRAYLMEVQIKRMSRAEWSKKWQRWNEYFGAGHYLQASWQRFKKGGGLIPNVLAYSRQEKDIVAEGFRVPGRTVETIEISMLTTVLTKHNHTSSNQKN